MRCSFGDDESGRFSTFTVEAVVRRKPGFFVKSGQLVFASITIVSFFVFGIPAEHDKIGERLSYGSTTLLTSLSFKWLITEHIPNLSYNTYLDDYIQYGFYIQVLIMLSNAAMIFVQVQDENGEIDKEACQLYDYICFILISLVWGIYQIHTYLVRLPRIIRKEHEKLQGMTQAKFEKVSNKFLNFITRRTMSVFPNSIETNLRGSRVSV